MSHKCLLVGCGGISDGWLTAIGLMEDLDLVGLVDLNKDAAEAKAATYAPDAYVGTDLAVAIRESQADVVFDCTVPSAHVPVDTVALEAGCHVLCEKPLADSLESARAVLAAAERHQRTHAVMQNRRFKPEIRALRSLIASGSLGELTTVTADFFIGAHFEGFRAEMEHVLLLDMAIHTFDAARFLTGARPSRVSCTEWNPAGSWFRHGASANATFEMDNGLVFSYRGSWTAEGFHTSWESSWRVIGTEGSALWDGGEQLQAERASGLSGLVRKTEPVATPDVESSPYTGHYACIREFIDAIDEGRPPETSSTDNYYSLAMSLAAVESARLHKSIDIEVLP